MNEENNKSNDEVKQETEFFNSDDLGSLFTKEFDYLNYVNQVYYF